DCHETNPGVAHLACDDQTYFLFDLFGDALRPPAGHTSPGRPHRAKVNSECYPEQAELATTHLVPDRLMVNQSGGRHKLPPVQVIQQHYSEVGATSSVVYASMTSPTITS